MISEISIYRIDGKWFTRIINGEAKAELALASFYTMSDDPTLQDMLDALQEVGLAYEVQSDAEEIEVDFNNLTATWERKEKAMTIEGVPEGWELVRVGILQKGDWFVNMIGDAEEWVKKTDSAYFYPIIRKIEKPKKFRQFANAAEADPFWNAALKYKRPNEDAAFNRFRINTIGHEGITIGIEYYSYAAAFNKFVCAADGSPFGVEVTE